MESGHNKNVANLQIAVINITNLGSEYAPPQDLITLPELQTLLTASQSAMSEVDTAEAEKQLPLTRCKPNLTVFKSMSSTSNGKRRSN